MTPFQMAWNHCLKSEASLSGISGSGAGPILVSMQGLGIWYRNSGLILSILTATSTGIPSTFELARWSIRCTTWPLRKWDVLDASSIDMPSIEGWSRWLSVVQSLLRFGECMAYLSLHRSRTASIPIDSGDLRVATSGAVGM